jgi:hypothetical protein
VLICDDSCNNVHEVTGTQLCAAEQHKEGGLLPWLTSPINSKDRREKLKFTLYPIHIILRPLYILVNLKYKLILTIRHHPH